jgi:ribosomal protein S18 acetylase RimI-like enzyme
MKFEMVSSSEVKLLDRCALLMSQSEPWITLKRDLENCKEAMRGDHKEVYVATDDGRLYGFIVLQMTGVFKGYIQSIFVTPESRGTGVGSALIQLAEERIFLVSPNVFMLVSAFNDRAARLYFQLGYEKIGTLKNFVADGYDELLLRKTIGPLKDFSSKIRNS